MRRMVTLPHLHGKPVGRPAAAATRRLDRILFPVPNHGKVADVWMRSALTLCVSMLIGGMTHGQESADSSTAISQVNEVYVLSAAQAARNGSGLRLMREPRMHLAGWRRASDQARWTIEVPQRERVLVRLIYSCHPEAEGSTLRLSCEDAKLEWVVTGSEDWSSYRTVELGFLILSPGRRSIEVTPSTSVQDGLLNLAAVELHSLPLPDEDANRVERWSAHWKSDRKRMREGARRAETFRLKLLARADDQPSRFDLLVEAMLGFQRRSRPALEGRPNLDAFKLERDALNAKALGDVDLERAQPFASFDGRWFGTWDQMDVDHWWHPTESLAAPLFANEEGPAIRQLQFAWIGDGFGWNYVAKSNDAEHPVILGMVYHVSSASADTISLERPHLGLAMGSGKLIWITGGELFFEEAFESDGVTRYAITGFHYEVSEGVVRQKGEAFQAIYSRDPSERREFYRFR